MYLNIQPPTMFVFLFFFAKVVLLKVVYRFKISQRTKFYGPTLTDASFAFT
jgi:hypothetical protein